jgi:hypothetical protein
MCLKLCEISGYLGCTLDSRCLLILPRLLTWNTLPPDFRLSRLHTWKSLPPDFTSATQLKFIAFWFQVTSAAHLKVVASWFMAITLSKELLNFQRSFAYIFAVDIQRLRNSNLGRYCNQLTKAQSTPSKNLHILSTQLICVFTFLSLKLYRDCFPKLL